MQASRSEFLAIRGLRYHVRHWGAEGAPKIFMVHGWMDVAASFQFVVDALQKDWHVIAPDWRGFGLSENSHADTYWFADYLADLDTILQHYQPDQAVNLAGHSMGGNVVTMYAGVRPDRVARLINLEGFGVRASQAEDAPLRLRKWLDEVRMPMPMRVYANQQEVAQRLQKNNPRLADERAQFLSAHWAAPNQEGNWVILGDAAHMRGGPLQFQVEQVLACWSKISAPVLWIEGEQTDIWQWYGSKEETAVELTRRKTYIPNLRNEVVAEAGHMLHHDQPEQVAKLLEEFLLS